MIHVGKNVINATKVFARMSRSLLIPSNLHESDMSRCMIFNGMYPEVNCFAFTHATTCNIT